MPEVSLVVVDDVAAAVALCNRYSPRFVATLISDDAAEHERVLRRGRRAVRRRRLHPLGRRPVRPRPARAGPVELAGRPAVRPRRRAVRRLGAHRPLPRPDRRRRPAPVTAPGDRRSVRRRTVRRARGIDRCRRDRPDDRRVPRPPPDPSPRAHRRTPGRRRASPVTDPDAPSAPPPTVDGHAAGARRRGRRVRSGWDRRPAHPSARQPRPRRAALRRRPDLRPRRHDGARHRGDRPAADRGPARRSRSTPTGRRSTRSGSTASTRRFDAGGRRTAHRSPAADAAPATTFASRSTTTSPAIG